MMAVLSRVPHCRPQLLPVELGTDMQHGQSMSVPPAAYHGGASSTLLASTTGLREAHPVPCARAAVRECASERSVTLMYGFYLSIAFISTDNTRTKVKASRNPGDG